MTRHPWVSGVVIALALGLTALALVLLMAPGTKTHNQSVPRPTHTAQPKKPNEPLKHQSHPTRTTVVVVPASPKPSRHSPAPTKHKAHHHKQQQPKPKPSCDLTDPTTCLPHPLKELHVHR